MTAHHAAEESATPEQSAGSEHSDTAAGLATGSEHSDTAAGLATGSEHSDTAPGLATGSEPSDAASGLATGYEHADESPGLLLWQVTNRWQAAIRAALAPFDLTHVQFVLLASLTYLTGKSGGAPVMQRDLATQAATDPMMTSQVLRTLEQKGLLERRGHPTDRRAKSLIPTKAGAALANRAVVAVESCDKAFFAPLSTQTPQFTTALRRLRDRA
ncbi:MarR family transcriptional regulator [Nocardia sp. NPDC051030]|uniref:MarR family winged helix-turn-helix transcriptional regulator n=1 Tax=Nocardia sp. NPDC051030 TaxID=3155162 RepID=UPI00341E53E5